MSRWLKIIVIIAASFVLTASVISLVFALMTYSINGEITNVLLTLFQVILVGFLLILLCKYPTPHSLRKKWKVIKGKSKDQEDQS